MWPARHGATCVEQRWPLICKRWTVVAWSCDRSPPRRVRDSARRSLTASVQCCGRARTPISESAVCVAKTQYSFSDKPTLLGAPTDFEITVRALRVSAGAGFVVALTGDIMTMPGLPKVPAAEKIDVDAEGRISGLF